jgi:hypothetical protein
MDENTIATVDFALALRFAAVLQAPLIVGPRPWRWERDSSRLRLHLERDGRPQRNAAHDRLPIISCGVALHHARVVLAACGVLTLVRTRPNPGEAGPLAELEAVGTHQTLPEDADLFAAIGRYDSGTRTLTSSVRRRLRAAASAEGAHLDEMNTANGWGAVIVTRSDDRTAWLNTGMALSAILLTATDAGLAAVPDRFLGGMAGRLAAGFGFPQIGVRIEHPVREDGTVQRWTGVS